MGKILALDYGTKRTGVAETDSLQIIASGLKTVPTIELHAFLTEYLTKEKIDIVVVGEARRMNDEASHIEKSIVPLINWIKKRYPAIKVEREDEGFTSQLAMQSMIQGGVKKKARGDKSLIDKVSATLILQRYMERMK